MKFANPTVANTEIQSLDDYAKIFKLKGFAAKLGYNHYKKVYIRTRAAESQNWKCCFCGIKMITTPNKINSCTAEHIIPHSEGGECSEENIAASCYRCNNRRGTMPAEEFDPFAWQKPDQKECAGLKKDARRRYKKYKKKIEEFLEIGYFNKSNEYVNCVADWVETLPMKSEYKKKLLQMYEEKKVA